MKHFTKGISLIRVTKETRSLSKYGEPLRRFSDFRSSILAASKTDHEEEISASAEWKKTELLKFNQHLPEIISDAVRLNSKHTDLEPSLKWLSKVLVKKLSAGTKHPGLATVEAFRIIANEENNEPTTSLIYKMGWCVEMLRKSFDEANCADDKSNTRGVISASHFDKNRLMESCLYQLLCKYFNDKPNFVHILALFQNVHHLTLLGHTLDKQTHDEGLASFTMNRYSTIAKYKTAYNTFALAALAALHTADITDPEIHRQAKTVSLEIGHFHQVQTDYLHCFEVEETKSNIAQGKCSWPAVVALQRATYYQRQILQECYGKPDEESVLRVKKLFEEIGVPATYRIYESRTYDMLLTQIQQCSSGLPHAMFYKLMERFYQRAPSKI